MQGSRMIIPPPPAGSGVRGVAMMQSAPAMSRKRLGVAGEKRAATFLRKEGYRILKQNYRCAYGELDLVASKGELLVFVEVKTRRHARYLHPALAVNWSKQQRLRQLAQHYMQTHPDLPPQPRFDVIAITQNAHHAQLEHFENAF